MDVDTQGPHRPAVKTRLGPAVLCLSCANMNGTTAGMIRWDNKHMFHSMSVELRYFHGCSIDMLDCSWVNPGCLKGNHFRKAHVFGNEIWGPFTLFLEPNLRLGAFTAACLKNVKLLGKSWKWNGFMIPINSSYGYYTKQYRDVQGIHPYLGPIFVPTGWERRDLEPPSLWSVPGCCRLQNVFKTRSFQGARNTAWEGLHQGITFLSKEYLVQVQLVDVRSQNANSWNQKLSPLTRLGCFRRCCSFLYVFYRLHTTETQTDCRRWVTQALALQGNSAIARSNASRPKGPPEIVEALLRWVCHKFDGSKPRLPW